MEPRGFLAWIVSDWEKMKIKKSCTRQNCGSRPRSMEPPPAAPWRVSGMPREVSVSVCLCVSVHTHTPMYIWLLLVYVCSCLSKCKPAINCTSGVLFFEVPSAVLMLYPLEDDCLQQAGEGCFHALHILISCNQWLELRRISLCSLQVLGKTENTPMNTVIWTLGLIVPFSPGFKSVAM